MNDTERITVGDTLIPLRRQLCDASGQPIDISADTITLDMTASIGGASVVSGGAVTKKQIGTGLASITGVTAANPPVVTVTNHGLSTGDMVIIDGSNMIGMDQIKGKQFQVTNIGTNTFSLDSVNGINYTAYVSGGSADTRGMVQYAWQNADVDESGNFYVQFIRTNAAQTEHIPAAKELRVEVIATV